MSHPLTLLTGQEMHHSELQYSKEYVDFRGEIARRRVMVGDVEWVMYEVNKGKCDKMPLIQLTSTVTTSECYYKMLLEFRECSDMHVIAVEPGSYWTVEETAKGQNGFLKCLNITKAHFYGLTMGAYILLHFSRKNSHKMASLSCTNLLLHTKQYAQSPLWVSCFAYSPKLLLCNYLLEALPSTSNYPDVTDFIVSQLEEIEQESLASRLTLNLTDSSCYNIPLPHNLLQFIDTVDGCFPRSLQDEVYRALPNVKKTIISGEDFPIQSNPTSLVKEIIQHIQDLQPNELIFEDIDELDIHFDIHLDVNASTNTNSNSIEEDDIVRVSPQASTHKKEQPTNQFASSDIAFAEDPNEEDEFKPATFVKKLSDDDLKKLQAELDLEFQ